MAGHGPIFGLGRAFGDVDHVRVSVLALPWALTSESVRRQPVVAASETQLLGLEHLLDAAYAARVCSAARLSERWLVRSVVEHATIYQPVAAGGRCAHSGLPGGHSSRALVETL
jgi:hypothetical protein